jgi:cytoskeletal protein CcmA (bactofilin family)
MATAEVLRERSIQNNTAPVSPRSEVDERRATAWIGQDVVVEGRIVSSQDLRIDGRVEGTIEVGDHTLMIGARAAVKANLFARSILISGAVVGNVTATERVDLQPTGSVEGDINAPRLVMADGAVVKGAVNAGGNRATKARVP